MEALLLDHEKGAPYDYFLKRLADLDSLTLDLQSDGTTLADACVLFDVVLKKYSKFKD